MLTKCWSEDEERAQYIQRLNVSKLTEGTILANESAWDMDVYVGKDFNMFNTIAMAPLNNSREEIIFFGNSPYNRYNSITIIDSSALSRTE